MIIFKDNRWDIDPYYLTIYVLGQVWQADKSKGKDVARAKLLWLYHMYNPHSPYRDYRKTIKSESIVAATFPKFYLEQKELELKEKIAEIDKKNKKLLFDNSIIDDEELEQVALRSRGESVSRLPKRKELHAVPELKIYDPAHDPELQDAIDWYKNDHLKKTPFWDSVSAYDDAMYNLADIIRSPKSTAAEIKSASTELDSIPQKRERMYQNAIKDEAQTTKVQGDKNIKRGEMLPNQLKGKKVAG